MKEWKAYPEKKAQYISIKSNQIKQIGPSLPFKTKKVDLERR